MSQTEGYLRQTLQNISFLALSNSTHENSFFQAWLNLHVRTQDSSYFFFFIVVEMFSSFDGDGLLLFSSCLILPKIEQTNRDLLED